MIQGLLLRLLMFFLPIAVWAAKPPAYLPHDLSDWEFDDNPANLCEGHYLPPAINPSPSSQISIEADGGEFDPTGASDLAGHVHMERANTQLDADQVHLKRDPESHHLTEIVANDHVRYADQDTRLESQTITLDVPNEKAILRPAAYRLYKRGARGQALEANITPRVLIMKSVSYTTCAPHKEKWWLTADRMHIDREAGRGYATHTKVYYGGVPIFYSPYFNFPTDKRRQSGFLFPNFKSSERSGSQFTAPYYFNLAPNYDAILTPKWISKRGEALNVEGRYLFTHATGEFETQILPGDSAYKTFKAENLAYHPGLVDSDPQVLGLERGSNTRFAFDLKQRTQSGSWSSEINYRYVADDNYLIDLEEDIAEAGTTQLLQSAQLNYNHSLWTGFMRFQSYETLHPYNGPVNTDPYRRLPQLHAKLATPFYYGITQVKGDTEFVYFYHPKDAVRASRINLRPIVSAPIERAAFTLTPRLQLDLMQYFLDKQGQTAFDDIEPNRVVPIFDIDSHLVFERHFESHGRAFSQTLEPRLYYLFVPYVDQNDLPNFESSLFDFSFQQLFRDNRFTGRDRIGDTNQLTLALTSHLFDSKNGRDMLHAGLGNTFYLRDRRVTDCSPIALTHCEADSDPRLSQTRSAIAAFVEYLVTDYLSVRTDIEWDPMHRIVDKQSSSASYRYAGRKIINLEYQYVKEDPAQTSLATDNNIEQITLSAAWPLSYKWELVTRVGYDFPNDRFFERLAGLEYDTCCTALRFVVKQYLEPNRDGLDDVFNTGYFVQFALKGLSSVGNDRVDQSLSTWIPGYRPQPENPWHRE